MNIDAYNSYAATSGVSGTNSSSDSSSSSNGITNLDVDDFLKLLITQLNNQDVMNPQSDNEFIAQMAQFTALQASKDLSNKVNYQYGSSLVGKYVTIGDEAKGLVDSVTFNGSKCFLEINGNSYDISKVTTVANAPEQE